jgi:hypothetical protein
LLQGWGQDGLLASYDAERRPIGARNVKLTAEFYGEHGKFDGLAAIEEDSAAGAQARQRIGEALVSGIGRMFRTAGLQLGYRYEDSPICVPDGTPPCPDDPEDFAPSARLGSRAPHLWLDDSRSMLDLYGHAFVLLRLGSDAPDASRFETAAASRRVPLSVITVAKPEAADLYKRRLVLVRPDGHVAWRSDEMPVNPTAIIDKVRGASKIFIH